MLKSSEALFFPKQKLKDSFYLHTLWISLKRLYPSCLSLLSPFILTLPLCKLFHHSPF